MQIVYDWLIKAFDLLVNYTIIFIELIGVAVLIYSVIKTLVGLFKKKEGLRLYLGEGIALSLEFKIGSELLRTVIVRQINELIILGCIILLRAALTFLIQWEIQIERKGYSIEK